MFRIRWFQVNWNSNFNTIVDAILNDKYDESKDYGFKASKRRENLLSASYIQKKEIEENIENPLTGEITAYQRIVFEQTRFNLENNKIGIELINPTRSVQSLLTTFASMSNFNITIIPMKLNLSKIFKQLISKFDKFVIQEMECKGIDVGNNTMVSLIAKNYLFDVSRDIEVFLNDKVYDIEKIKCSFEVNNISSNFVLTKNGALKTNEKNIDSLLPILKTIIMELE